MELSRRLILTVLVAFAVVWAYSRASAAPALCAFTGNITQIYGGGASTGAGVRVAYKGIVTQNSSGSIIPGGSQCAVTTDVNGNLPVSGPCTSFIQGVLMNITIGRGQPVQVQVPLASSADLSTLYIANNMPMSLVNSVIVAAGGDYALTVSASPSPGALGTVTLQPGNVFAFHAAGGTPTAWPIDFSAVSVTVGNATPIPLPTGAGMVLVNETSFNGGMGVYVCGGNACVLAGSSNSASWANIPSNATPSPSAAAVIFTAGVYTIMQNFGRSAVISIGLERTRNVP